MVDKIKFVINYSHNPCSCYLDGHEEEVSVLPTLLIVEYQGFYKDRINKIVDLLDNVTNADVFQIISQKTPLNALEIKKLTPYSYGTIRNVLQSFKKHKLIKFTRGISEKGKAEFKIKLNEPVVEVDHFLKKNVIGLLDDEEKLSENNRLEFLKWFDVGLKDIKKVKKESTDKKSKNIPKRH